MALTNGSFIKLPDSIEYAIYADSAKNVNYNDTSATNELQSLNRSGDTLYLTQGNYVLLSDSAYHSLQADTADYADKAKKSDSANTAISANTAGHAQNADTSDIARALLMEGDNGKLYQLKIDSNGNIYTKSTNPVGWTHRYFDLTGSKHYQTNFVKAQSNISLKWDKEITNISDWPPSQSTLTGDINDDGLLEIITIQNDILYILDKNANLLLNKNISADGMERSRASMIEDVNKDNVLDIGICYHNAYNSDLNNIVKAKIYDGNGNILNTFTKNASNGGKLFPITKLNDKIIIGQSCGYGNDPRGYSKWDITNEIEEWYLDMGSKFNRGYSIAEIDGDGVLEMLQGNRTTHNGGTGNGTTDGDCYTIMLDENGNKELIQKYDQGDSNGGLKDRFIRFFPDSAYKIVSFKDYESAYPGTSKIHIRDLSGNYQHTESGLNNSKWSSSWADVDNDGKKEIVTSNHTGSESELYVFDEKLSSQASLDLNSQFLVNAIADIDGDKKLEIKVFDSQLNEEFSWNVPTGEEVQINSVIVSDTDNNGLIEIIGFTDQRVFVLEGE